MASERLKIPVKIYRTGDVCPFCGGRIVTEDPFMLGVITGLAWRMELDREETRDGGGDGDG